MKRIPSLSTCCTLLPVIVIVVVPFPKPPASMPRQPPPQLALVMTLFVTMPVNVPMLPALDLPMVMALEPLPAPVQSVETLLVIVLVLIVPVMLLVPEPWKKTPGVFVIVQLLSVPFIVDALFDPIVTPLLNNLLNVHAP